MSIPGPIRSEIILYMKSRNGGTDWSSILYHLVGRGAALKQAACGWAESLRRAAAKDWLPRSPDANRETYLAPLERHRRRLEPVGGASVRPGFAR
jgi:hypothetical protein